MSSSVLAPMWAPPKSEKAELTQWALYYQSLLWDCLQMFTGFLFFVRPLLISMPCRCFPDIKFLNVPSLGRCVPTNVSRPWTAYKGWVISKGRIACGMTFSSGTHRSGTNWHSILISLSLPNQDPVPESSIYVVYLALFVYQLCEA